MGLTQIGGKAQIQRKRKTVHRVGREKKTARGLRGEVYSFPSPLSSSTLCVLVFLLL
jgi:hypothetical protein